MAYSPLESYTWSRDPTLHDTFEAKVGIDEKILCEHDRFKLEPNDLGTWQSDPFVSFYVDDVYCRSVPWFFYRHTRVTPHQSVMGAHSLQSVMGGIGLKKRHRSARSLVTLEKRHRSARSLVTLEKSVIGCN